MLEKLIDFIEEYMNSAKKIYFCKDIEDELKITIKFIPTECNTKEGIYIEGNDDIMIWIKDYNYINYIQGDEINEFTDSFVISTNDGDYRFVF